jgi:hypothetical protein
MVRRSTPYAFHDGTIGSYFLGFCRAVAELLARRIPAPAARAFQLGRE